jgi:hypothetical protein
MFYLFLDVILAYQTSRPLIETSYLLTIGNRRWKRSTYFLRSIYEKIEKETNFRVIGRTIHRPQSIANIIFLYNIGKYKFNINL